MKIEDRFANWIGPGILIVRDGRELLTLEGNAIPPDQTWFLRIVEATADERKTLEDAGYLIKNV